MSPAVKAELDLSGETALSVAQALARAAGKEAAWAHAYARRRRSLGVKEAARAALLDVGVEEVVGAIPQAIAQGDTVRLADVCVACKGTGFRCPGIKCAGCRGTGLRS